MAIRSYSGVDGYAAADNFVVVTDTKSWQGNTAKKPPLIYCHGAGSSAYRTLAGVDESKLLTSLAKDYVVISGDWGGLQFGNDLSMDMMNNALAYIRSEWNATNDPPVVVGWSMGGCQVLNYALDFPVTAVAAAIPLTDLNRAYAENVLGIAPYVDQAYGGTYDPVVDGERNDPLTFAHLIPNTVPICLFVSTNDTVVPPETAHQFCWKRPSTKYKELGALGHSGAVPGLKRADITSFLGNPTGYVGDPVPDPPTGTITYMSAGAQKAYSTATAVAIPSGVVAKDIVIIFAMSASATATFTWPSGFVEKARVVQGAMTLAVAWKRASSSESGTYTITASSGAYTAQAHRISGAIATGDPFRQTPNAVGSTPSEPNTSLTAVPAGDLLFHAVAATHGSLVLAPPSGYTDRNSGGIRLGAATKLQATTGDTGNVNGGNTTAINPFAAILFSLISA